MIPQTVIIITNFLFYSKHFGLKVTPVFIDVCLVVGHALVEMNDILHVAHALQT